MRTAQPGAPQAINSSPGGTQFEGVTEMNAGARGGIGSIPGMTTADGRTLMAHPQGAFNNASQGEATSFTAIPNEIFGSAVEQSNPIVVHAESDVSQPMGTEIPLETVENSESIPRREISTAEANRIVDAMIEEQKQQSRGRHQ